MIEVVVTSAGASTYLARVGGRQIGTFKTPLLSAARILAADGIEPDTPIVMRWANSKTVSMRSTVGAAATLTVEEGDGAPRFVKHQPWSSNRMPIPYGASAHQRPEALAA